MRWMFVFLVTLLITSDFLGHNPGLGPGLSLKNAFLYMIAMAILFRMALSGNFKFRLPGLHMAWGMWVGYAILTFFAAWLVIHYRSYDALQSAIALKSDLIDSCIFCFAAFYGLQDEKDYRTVLYAVMAAIGVSSVLTLTDLVGLTGLGTKLGESGAEADRVFGAFGHANETGALLSLMLPGTIALTMTNRGFWRLFWLGCAVSTAAVFVLTVSRGAFVGVAVGYPIAVLMLRKVIPPGRIAAWAFSGVILAILGGIVMAIADPRAAASIADRVFGIGTMGMSEASSGRTDIWAQAFNAMMDNPITLVTGFGWNVYSTMPTVFAMHNTYLDQWFNLGLLGVATYVYIIYSTVRTAKEAVMSAVPPIRTELMAYVFGMLGLAVSVFFGNLYTSKPYIWMYVGLTMRGAMFVLDKVTAQEAAARAPAPRLGVGVSLRRA
jgi:O-antigen ligase